MSDPKRGRKIEDTARAMGAWNVPIRLLLPTYELGDGRQLILDGNHRLCAALETGLPTTIVAVSLRGAVDRAVLPDLHHWDDDRARATGG
jgi:hypothetical protein